MPVAFAKSVLIRNPKPFFTVAAGSLGTINDNNRNTANNIVTNPIATSQAGLPSHSIVSGSLPTGLTLNSNGTIEGIATSVGSYSISTFTVRATIESASTDREFTIAVNDFNVSGAIMFDPVDTNVPGLGFPDPIYLTDMSYVETTNSILPTTDTQNEVTFSIWLKPRSITGVYHYVFKISQASGTDYAYLGVDESGYIDFKFGTVEIAGFTRSALTYNAWNHILISIKRDHTTSATFGEIGGAAFNLTNYRSYDQGTSQLSRTHLVINGTAYHRYTQFNGPYPDTSGFFQNDFASGTTGSNATFGYFAYNSGSSDLFTMGSGDNTILGGHYGIAGPPQQAVGYYKGDMAEMWIKNSYLDMTDSENIKLFRNGNGKPVDPPASPSTYFKGTSTTWASSGSIDEGTITRNRITDAGTLPSD